MNSAAKGSAPGGRADPLELSSFGSLENSENRPLRSNTQDKFQAPVSAEFDVEIARALIASGWRATAYLLMNAALLIDAGDFLSTERNRQSAREQFVVANGVFRQLMEARAAEAVSRFAAEAFL